MYCTSNDIAIQLGYDADFSNTTKPTKGQVESIISRIDAELDIYLSQIGLSVPVTDATFLKFITGKSIAGASGKVGMTYFFNNAGVENTQAKMLWQEYLDFLTSLKDDPEIFAGYMDAMPNPVSSNVLDGTYTAAELDGYMMPKEYNK